MFVPGILMFFTKYPALVNLLISSCANAVRIGELKPTPTIANALARFRRPRASSDNTGGD